jgi:hypothetical protein
MVVDHHALEDANILLDKTHLRHNVQGPFPSRVRATANMM